MSFGYQVLGFGSGVSASDPISVQYLVVAGGGAGGGSYQAGGGGAGGLLTDTIDLTPGIKQQIPLTIS